MSEFKFLDKWGLPYPPRKTEKPFIRPFHQSLRIEEKVELEEALREYPGLKLPHSPFPFCLNKNRREGLKGILGTKEVSVKKIINLLESNDFVDRMAGLELLKKIPTISEENLRKFLTLLEPMKKDRIKALRRTLVYALPKLGEKGLQILEEMENDVDPEVQKAVAQARVQIIIDTQKEKALPLLEKMKNDKNWVVRQAIVQNIPTLGEKAMPILEEKSKDEDWRVREEVVRSVVKLLREKALLFLEKMRDDKNWMVRKAVAQARVQIIIDTQKEKALPLLEKIINLEKKINDESWILRKIVAQALPKLGEKALPLLEKMKNDEYPIVQETVEQAILRIKGKGGYKWRMITSNPLFATPFTQEVAQRVFELQEIAKKLEKKFNGKFVGFIIIGSIPRGYFNREKSDVDYAFISQNEECSVSFKEMARHLNLGAEHYIAVNEKWQIIHGEKDFLFRGLFFGNRKRLSKIQWELLQNIDKEEWDKMREEIMERETNLFLAQERLGLTEEELEKIIKARILLGVVPSYEETLKIIEKRGKRTEK